jgi:hypothetical protein
VREEDIDLVVVLAGVVQVLKSLLRPNELELMSLGWSDERVPEFKAGRATELREDGVFYSDTPPRFSLRRTLVLALRLKGESFQAWLAAADDESFDAELACERLHSDLQDFIAESRFGWGELR